MELVFEHWDSERKTTSVDVVDKGRNRKERGHGGKYLRENDLIRRGLREAGRTRHRLESPNGHAIRKGSAYPFEADSIQDTGLRLPEMLAILSQCMTCEFKSNHVSSISAVQK